MKVDKTKVRGYLNDFDFEGLFINEIGWGYSNEPHILPSTNMIMS